MRAVLLNAVTDFAKTMSMENIAIPESGKLQFVFDEIGTFNFEEKEDGMVFYLIKEIPEYIVNEQANKILELCHYEESRGFDVQSALYEGTQLIFLTWLADSQVDVAKIESILGHLVDLHKKVLQ